MPTLHFELIVEEILPRLPAKSLVRFKCVSKSFKTVISSPRFIDLHRRHSLSSDANRLLFCNTSGSIDSSIFYVDLDNPENPPKPLALPATFKPSRQNPIVQYCHGLLCIPSYDNCDLLVINPSTGLFTVVPLPEIDLYGFGYDGTDCKVIGFNLGSSDVISVYNLKDGVWRTRTVGSSSQCKTCSFMPDKKYPITFRGFCHWLVWCLAEQSYRIACLGICSETWAEDVPLPNYDGSEDSFEQYVLVELQVFDGFLSVWVSSKDEYYLWVMKEYGKAESWVKLFRLPDIWYSPLAYAGGSRSKVLFRTGSSRSGPEGQLIWYNVKDEQCEEAEIHHVHGVHGIGHLSVCLVKGSLFGLPKIV